MACWYADFKLNATCSVCGFRAGRHNGTSSQCPEATSVHIGRGPWLATKFILASKNPCSETHKAKVDGSKASVQKVYRGSCPCGIQHPAACTYHEIQP